MTTARPHSRTFGDLLDELAAATPQAPALVSGAERFDFATLKAIGTSNRSLIGDWTVCEVSSVPVGASTSCAAARS